MAGTRRTGHARVLVGTVVTALVAAGVIAGTRTTGDSAVAASEPAATAMIGPSPHSTHPTHSMRREAPRSPHGTEIAPADSSAPVRTARRTVRHGTVSRVNFGPGDAQADGSLVGRPSISADGRYVAFASPASNLVRADRNNFADVFVRDRLTRRTMLVSATPAGRPGAGSSGSPALSADGRWVAFESWAGDLVPGPAQLAHGGVGVFLRDLRTGRTELLRRGRRAGGRADGSAPAINAVGSRVAFESRATNLVPDDRNGHSDIFVWTAGDGLDRISRDTAGKDLPGGAAGPAMSADGNRIAFVTAGTRGGECEDVEVKDLAQGTLTLASVTEGCGRYSDVAISAEGGHVAFSTTWPMSRADTDWTADVYLRDLERARTAFISAGTPVVPAVSERGASYAPALSADGRWVGFTSFARDLIGRDLTHEQYAYLHDRRTDRTSRIAMPTGPDGTTYGVALSPDAAHLAFGGAAQNLVAGDNNHADDVFVLDRAGTRYPVERARVPVDVAAPNSLFTIGPVGTVLPGLQRFVVRADEPGVQFRCQLDAGKWRDCRAAFRMRIGPGNHVVRVRAVDAAGNVEQSPAARQFRVRR